MTGAKLRQAAAICSPDGLLLVASVWRLHDVPSSSLSSSGVRSETRSTPSRRQVDRVVLRGDLQHVIYKFDRAGMHSALGSSFVRE
jgi:hypothetical protein